MPPAEPEPPPLVLDAVGRKKLVEEAAGKSARQVRRMLADLDPELAPPADRVRPLGDGRYELKATIDAECQQGLEQLRGLLSHVDPRMTLGQLVGRVVREALDRHDPSRPPRRARGGSRPADAKANAPRTPTPEQAQRRSAPAAKHAARPADTAAAPKTGRRPPRRPRRRSDTGAGGSADTDLCAAAAEHPGGDGPPSGYQGEAHGHRHSDGAVMRFGPRDFGGCQTTGCGNATAGAAATPIHRPGAVAIRRI